MFFQVTGSVVEKECESVMDQLSKDLDLPFLSMHFRRDPFFVFSERFPIVHPLIRYPESLSEDAYKKGMGAGCSLWYEHRGCAPDFR